MLGLIYLYATAVALVALQCGIEAAHIDNSKMDNSLQPNGIQKPAPKRFKIRNFVRIVEPPPETVRYEPGTILEVPCTVIGKPAPSIRWMKNGEPLNDFSEDLNDIMPADPTGIAHVTSKLILKAAADGDVYTCVATSGLKRTTATTTVYSESDEDAQLLDIQKLLFKPARPIITYTYLDLLQNMGTAVVLPCRVYSPSKALVFWEDPDYNIIYGDSGRRQVLPSGDLLITDLRFSDVGNFTCTAKNMYGKESAVTFLYTVKPDH